MCTQRGRGRSREKRERGMERARHIDMEEKGEMKEREMIGGRRVQIKREREGERKRRRVRSV